MGRNIAAYRHCQVFLNYPFDREYEGLASAMSFAVIAGGLLPVCALDLNVPDRPRLDMLIEAIQSCDYSAHDLSRCRGEGPDNLARMNMPIEMGMSMFYALTTHRERHRCILFVSTQYDYQSFVSDLSGLDPKCHSNNEVQLLKHMYEWLRSVVPEALFNSQPTINVVDRYSEFRERLSHVNGSGEGGQPSHGETREVMYQVCASCGWWEWRETRPGKAEFPELPIAWKS